MPDSFPNLPELLAVLETSPDAYSIAAAFSLSSLEETRAALRSQVAGWEQEAAQ